MMRFTLLTLLAFVVFGAAAQDDAEQSGSVADIDLENETERCIFTRSIRRIEAIDDSTIAFYMGGDRVYVNVLPHRCPGLQRNNRIAYETRGGRLCRMDRISVIYSSVIMDTGIPCPLGDFHRSDPESVEIMSDAVEQRGATSPVKAEPVELPPLEEEDAETD